MNTTKAGKVLVYYFIVLIFAGCSHKSSAPMRRAPINGWRHLFKKDNPGSFHGTKSKETPF